MRRLRRERVIRMRGQRQERGVGKKRMTLTQMLRRGIGRGRGRGSADEEEGVGPYVAYNHNHSHNSDTTNDTDNITIHGTTSHQTYI